jgi:hypothetical protein
MHTADLERAIDRQLRRLPLPTAPASLVPRVLAAAREWTTRPWYAREWLAWPLACQAASLAFLILVVAGGARLLPSASEAASAALTPMAGLLGQAAADLRRAAAAAAAARALPRALFEPIGPFVLAYMLAMGFACAALAAALDRLVLSESRR